MSAFAPHPSDSRVQREIEAAILRRLEAEHLDWESADWKAISAELSLADVWRGTRPDGVWLVRKRNGVEVIIAECYLRIGPLAPGHVRKIALDVLKLVTMQRNVSSSCHTRFMLIVPEELAQRLTGKGWIHEALRLVEIVPVALLDEERAKLDTATMLQAQGQARTKPSR